MNSTETINLPMTYAQTLTQAWQQHLAPKAPDAPRVVSTFAGCGGSSLGYSMAGFHELLAVEWEAHAAETFRHNFPHVPVFEGDIKDVDPAMLDLAPGELEVFDGSPPCQGFSTFGKRQIDDPRNQLFRQFTRLIEAWAPKTFVMENVSGMIKGSMKSLFVEILQALKAAAPGYRVSARLVDARYLGIPQMRQRLVFIGVREDLALDPVHPSPRPRSEIVTVRQAIGDLTPDELGLVEWPGGRIVDLLRTMKPGESGATALVRAGKKGNKFSMVRLDWDRPSYTIVKHWGGDWAGFFHPTKDRFLSVRELARLQSFPDEYDWGESSYRDIHARIGNSVPPLMMRAIASTLRADVLDLVKA